MGGGWGAVEKWILKLTSAKVEVEVEAELGKISKNISCSKKNVVAGKNLPYAAVMCLHRCVLYC